MPHDFKVNVRVDATPGEDLMKVLEDMRQEYEFIIKKKHQELDTWFKEQVKQRFLNFPNFCFPVALAPVLMALPLLGLTVSSHVPGGGQSSSCAEQPE